MFASGEVMLRLTALWVKLQLFEIAFVFNFCAMQLSKTSIS